MLVRHLLLLSHLSLLGRFASTSLVQRYVIASIKTLIQGLVSSCDMMSDMVRHCPEEPYCTFKINVAISLAVYQTCNSSRQDN